MPKKILLDFTKEYNISWDGLYGAYTVDCSASETLPSLKFVVEGGSVEISPLQYIYLPERLPNGKCVLSFEDSKAYGFGPECETLPSLTFVVEGGSLEISPLQYIYLAERLPNGKCVLSFEDSKAYGFGPEWYVGLQIMTDYCVSFDYEKKRIGFTHNALFVPGCHHG
uniref:Peptidase A1 domain-containing protein n=1 Tax=Steinernema glaseri TaxID=37863 RepID=A0A1I7ZYT7_9BILA